MYYTNLKIVKPAGYVNKNIPAFNILPVMEEQETRNSNLIDWIIVTAPEASPYTDEDLFWVKNPIYECYVLNYPNIDCLSELWDYKFTTYGEYNHLLIYRNILTTEKIDKNDSYILNIISQ